MESNTSFNTILPKFGLRYDLSDNVILGGTVARAYRAGGTSVSTVSGQITEFEPEFTWNYELSLRAQTPDRMFSIEANAFYTDWKDQIVTQITAFGRANGISIDTESVNAGQSEVYGAELSVEGRPDDRLSAFAAVGFVETKFSDFVTATEDLSGNQFNNASPITARAGFSWRHPTGFRVSGDVNLRSEYYSVSTNDSLLSTFEPVLDDTGAVIGQRNMCTEDPCNDRATEVKASTVVNMKAGYEAEHWSIFAFARNLLNEDYLTQRNAPENGGRRLGRTGEPRAVGVELNLKFGGI